MLLPPGNWIAPPAGNRSRLFLSNEKHSLSSDFPAGSRAPVDERRSDVGLLKYKAVLHHRDIVVEIATQRHGEIEAIDQYISDGKKQPPHRWRVRFLDGREPTFQYFLNEEHLRLIRCPHEGQ